VAVQETVRSRDFPLLSSNDSAREAVVMRQG
jgi:hypothetical protein